MSASLDLRHALLSRLLADGGVAALVGTRIYDNPPAAPVFPYLSFGSVDWSTENLDGLDARRISLQIDAWVRSFGRLWPVMELTDAVAQALHAWRGEARDSAVSSLQIESVRTFMDPDGETARGVVTVTAHLEAS